jgi:hypothetical protein
MLCPCSAAKLNFKNQVYKSEEELQISFVVAIIFNANETLFVGLTNWRRKRKKTKTKKKVLE